jgi:hypothetical protein
MIAAKPQQPQRVNKMTLASVVKGKQEAPYRLLVYGVDKIGKSTFGADAPDPIFLCSESGTNHLDVARFPAAETWEDILDAIATLTETPGEYKTLVIDSVDWAEPLLWDAMCRKENVDNVEKVGGGYGKYVNVAVDGWRVLLGALERLQQKQGLNVILIGHALIKNFKNPEGQDFDRYILKLQEKAAALLREWVEGVYFCQFETFAVEDKNKRVKGVSSGMRKLYTQRTAAYDAGDRYGLPTDLSLAWAEFDKLAKAGIASQKSAFEERIAELAAKAPADLKTQIESALQRANGDAKKLAQLADWAASKVAA